MVYSLPLRMLHSFSGIGLLPGTLFFAASPTPSLVPRAPAVQGLLGGSALSAGYGIGVLVQAIWAGLQLPMLQGRTRLISNAAAAMVCAVVAVLALWWAAGW